ncbi:MAG: transporter substrate-binding domain-containing protein [Clostridiales bacterium]|nr:transporter substrate-binding domain-containing protein [Clostridiales bacterium]
MNMKKTIAISLAVCLALILAACGGGTSSGGGGAINSPADFPGHEIAVQVDTTAAISIDEMIEDGMTGVTVHRYEKVTQCFDDLALERVDAVYVDSVVAGYYLSGGDKYRLAWVNDEGEPLGLCLAKESTALLAAVEAALDTMFFDGSMSRIAVEHFGEDFTAGLRNPSSAPTIPMDFTTIAEGKLLVGVEVGYPPMEYLAEDGRTPIGFDIDVSYRLGELLGLEVEFVNTAWDGIFFALERGEYDIIISSVSITEPRKERYLLTEPYVSNALSIVVRNE